MTYDRRLAELVASLDVYSPQDTRNRTSNQRGLSDRQAQRRAAILAAARGLFNEGGAKLVTVRRLVSRAGSTAPTIYSLVGNSDTVLEQALIEHHETCIALAPAVAECLDLNVVNGFCETVWMSVQAQPLYARRQILLMWRSLEGRRTGKVLAQLTIEAIELWVRSSCGRSRLARRVGHDNLAAAIEAQIRIALLEWAEGTDSLFTLRRKLARATICLLRFVDEAISGRIANWLEYTSTVHQDPQPAKVTF